MRGIPLFRSAIDDTRRLGALGLFRLASCVLRDAIKLYRRDMLSSGGLHGALSVVTLLERWAKSLLFGRKRSRNHDEAQAKYRP
jgi:hypothetical protein